MKPFYKITSAAIAALFLAGSAQAQIDSCNVFLQGNHVEVGISPSGSYGSCVPAPSGYHPHGAIANSMYHPCSSGYESPTPLGFVADPLFTGWSTDSLSHYMGDYFLPGDPFEGWSIQIGGVQYQGFNTNDTLPAGLTGSNIGYTSVVGQVTSTWQGSVDSVEITQVTTLDSGSLYFTVQVTFTNLGTTPVNNLYYFRSVDPDNDETWPGGSFPTINNIVNQGPDTTLVTAYGVTGTWTTMGLGTTDTNARCIVYETWPLVPTVDLGTIYNQTYATGTSLYAQGATDTVDWSIGIVYLIPHLATVDSAADSIFRTTSTAHLHPANSATITYFYAFGQAGIDSALASSSRTDSTTNISLGVTNVNSNTTLKVYPNPANETFNVLGLNAGDQLVLFDMMGRVVVSQQVGSAGVNSLSVNNVAPGAYILIAKDVNGNVEARVPVQKL